MSENNARELILKATLDTIAECSISNAGMRTIAERAGMKQPSLHYYFKTKKDLLLQLMEWTQEHYDALMDAHVETKNTLEEKLGGYFSQEKHCILNESAYTKVSFDLWGLGQHDPEINECYMRHHGIWRGRIIQTLGEFMPDLSEEEKTLVAAMIVSMLMGGAMQYLSNPKAFDLDHYVDFCLRAALLSIGRQMPEEPTNDTNP